MRLQLLSVVALAGCVVGCNKSPEGGTTPTNSAGFKISPPVSATGREIKQGDSATYDASINRDSGFQKDVKLTVTAPDKVSVKLDKDSIKASDETKFTIKVSPAKDAALGEQTIKVTGTPDNGGNPTTAEFKVTVVK